MKLLFFLLLTVFVLRAQDQQVLAVVDLENGGGVIAGDITAVSDAIAAQAGKDRRYFLFDRALIGPVLSEQGFPQTGACSHEQCLTALGNLLAAHKIIGGSIRREGSQITLELLLVDVHSGAADNRVEISEQTSRAEFLTKHIPRAVKDLLAVKPSIERKASSHERMSQKKKRRWWIPVTGVIAAGAAGAGALWYFTQEGGAGDPGESGPVSLDDAPVRER